MRKLSVFLALGIAACSSNGTNNNGDLGGLGNSDLLGAPMVAIGGHLTAASNGTGSNPPLSGATIQIMGASPAITTTTAADGSWTLMVPQGATVFVGATASSYQGGQVGLLVPTGGTTSVDFQMISTMILNQVAMGLSPMVTVDSTKGLVAIDFKGVMGAPGFSATLGANHGNAFAPNAMTYTNTTPGGQDGNTLVFPNVDTGTTTVTLTAPTGHSCTALPLTSYRVDPGYFTFLSPQCM
jgi:hypothetical protein